MSPPLLTTRHVAELIGVNTETVLRWVRRGVIPAIRLPGGRIRFRQADVEMWLGERATPAQGVLATRTGAAQSRPYPLGSVPLANPEGKE